jgi:hypothetical protein
MNIRKFVVLSKLKVEFRVVGPRDDQNVEVSLSNKKLRYDNYLVQEMEIQTNFSWL